MLNLLAVLPVGDGTAGGGGAPPGVIDGSYAGIKCLVRGVMTLECLPGVFSLLVNAILSFVGVASLIMLVYSGIQMIIANGDAKTLETAGKSFTHALIGLLLVLCSFLIINFIASVTGVHCLTSFGFSCNQ